MSEAVVLQPPLSQKEMQCAEQVAKDLDLLVEKVSSVIIKTVLLRPQCDLEDIKNPLK